ncbi:MAG: hypothetical protein RL501_1472 [Bacteroidota bacterium]
MKPALITYGGSSNKKLIQFFVFLLLSFLIWSIQLLSEPSVRLVRFSYEVIGVPTGMYWSEENQDQLEVQVLSNGFSWLKLWLDRPKLTVDLSNAVEDEGIFFLEEQALMEQLNAKASRNYTFEATLLGSGVKVKLYRQRSKKVPVQLSSSGNRLSHYILFRPTISPDSVWISGPAAAVDTLSFVRTSFIDLSVDKEDIEEVLSLDLPEGYGITADPEQVLFTGHWVKYAEHKIEVPIEVLGLPEGWLAKTFPNKVEVLFRAPIEQLKRPMVSDFKVFVLYDQNQAEQGKVLWSLDLEVFNPAIEHTFLSIQRVELIVQKP